MEGNIRQLEDQLQKQHLSATGDNKNDEVDIRLSDCNWLVLERKQTAAAKTPRLGRDRWRDISEKIRPELVETVMMSEVNLGLCYRDVFNFTAKCKNTKQLALYDLIDDSGENTDIVDGVKSAISLLTSLNHIDILGVYLGKRGNDVFNSINCPALRVLRLHKTHLSGGGASLVNCLSRHPLLSYLNLYYCGLLPEEIKQVVQCLSDCCPQMIFLKIFGSSFTFSEFKSVCNLTELKCLEFAAETADDLVEILKHLSPMIQMLYVLCREKMTKNESEFLSSIRRYKNLNYLVVDEDLLDAEVQERVGETIVSKGGRFVNSDTDPQGWQNYKAQITKMREESLQID